MGYFIWDSKQKSLTFSEHTFSQIKLFDIRSLSETMDDWLNGRLEYRKKDALEKFLINAPKQYLWNQNIFQSHDDKIIIARRISEQLRERDNILSDEVKEKIYYPFVECFYDLAKKGAKSQPEILNYACRFWIRTLTEPKNRYFDSYQHDREEKVKSAIYEKTENRELYSFLGDSLNRPIVRWLSTWFLKRYDLKTAKHLSDFLIQKETQEQTLLSQFCKQHKRFLSLFGRLCDKFSKKAWFQRHFKKSGGSQLHSETNTTEEYPDQRAFIEQIIQKTDAALIKLRQWGERYIYWLVLSTLIVLSPVFIFSDNPFPAPVNKIPVSYSWVQNGNSVEIEKEYDVRRAFYIFRLLTWLAYALVISKMVEVFGMPTRMRLLMPRLFCATFLGYLPLIVGDEVWKYAATVSPWIRGVIIAGSITFICLYLRSEIGNVIGFNSPQKKKVVWKRTFHILFTGVSYALVFGLILMDLFCMQFLKNIGPEMLDYTEKKLLTGFFGVIEYEVWPLFSCIASLIGIFVQIFWEDKPITEPL